MARNLVNSVENISSESMQFWKPALRPLMVMLTLSVASIEDEVAEAPVDERPTGDRLKSMLRDDLLPKIAVVNDHAWLIEAARANTESLEAGSAAQKHK